MNRKFFLLAPLGLALALCACDKPGPSPEEAQRAAREQAAKLAYENTIKAWRAERVQRLTKPDGWLSLVGMHWLERGNTRVGSGPGNGTRIAAGPDKVGVVNVDKNEVVRFTAESGAGVTIDGQPAAGQVVLVTDADATREPTVVGFYKGDASFIVIKRGERYALRVRDALAPTRTGFQPLQYFPIDPAFRLRARFSPHAPGSKIDIVNILGIVEPMDNPGTVTFEKDGKSFTLEAVDEGDHRLFFVYADRTSGHESYAASRFVYADYPDKTGFTTLDFNKGYNPPCAFTAFSTCPMPPLQNRLDLAITAGEKKPLKPNAGFN
jgi:uncharacterized protein (DUF1684 family)